MRTATVIWIERIGIGYGDYVNNYHSNEVEFEGDFDIEAMERECERRFDEWWIDYRGIYEVWIDGVMVWES